MLLSPDFDGTIESLNHGEFATFNQIKAEGGKLRKGSKGLRVVFYSPYVVKDTNEKGEQHGRIFRTVLQER